MDVRMILDVLNELLVLEQASLARRFLESTVFVSHMTVEALTTVESMAQADEEHSARLTDAIIRLGGVPGLRFADPRTSDLHYMEINHALPRLVADREAVAAQLSQTTDPMLAEERRRSLAALDQQLAGLERMRALRESLLARMATAVVGLESVATRMGEVVTMGADAYQHDAAGDALRDAGADLEALRTGLAEAQQLARGVSPEE